MTEYNPDNFRLVRDHKPEHGDVICKYNAVAYFVNGDVKRNIIHQLLNSDNSLHVCLNQMLYLVNARYKEALECLKQMLNDLSAGMTEEQVLMKEYRFVVEMFYYTKPKFFPKDNEHWTLITLKNIEEEHIKTEYKDEHGKTLDPDMLEVQIQQGD